MAGRRIVTVDPREFGALEATVRHLAAELAKEAEARARLSQQMDQLQAVLQQVRGARWTLVAIIGASGLIGSAITSLFPFIRS